MPSLMVTIPDPVGAVQVLTVQLYETSNLSMRISPVTSQVREMVVAVWECEARL